MTEDMYGKVIAENISKLRTEHNETQQQLADAIGVSRVLIMHYENATRQIKAGTIVKIAKHFDVSADYLLGLSPIKTPDRNTARQIAEFAKNVVTDNLTDEEKMYIRGLRISKYAVQIIKEDSGEINGKEVKKR